MAKASMNSKGTIKGFPYTLNISQDVEIAYSTFPVIDPDWKHRDKRGHQHYYKEEDGLLTLPTLKEVEETYWCPDCCDQHVEVHFECPLCGERVIPGVKAPPMEGEAIPGRIEISVTVQGDAGKTFVMPVMGDLYEFQRVGTNLEKGQPAMTEYIAMGKL